MVKLLYQKLPEGALKGQAEVEQLISALQDQAQAHGVQMQHSLEVQLNYLIQTCLNLVFCNIIVSINTIVMNRSK